MSDQEIELMPRRLMSMNRADELISMLKATGLVNEVLVQKHKYYDGKYLVGRFILLINGPPNEVISKITPICEKMMPYGYDIRVGKFIKPRPTVSDYIRGAIYWSESSEGGHK